MSLTPTLKNPSDLLAKLERESYRTFHTEHPLHKADHFYNFCITAHAMKDFVFEYLEITKHTDKENYYRIWNKCPEMVAASEIANSSKHLVLRDSNNEEREIKTKSVKGSTSSMVEVYKDNRTNNLVLNHRDNCFDYEIILVGGTSVQLFVFTKRIIDHWVNFFNSNDIPYNKQSECDLFGDSL